MGTEYRAKAPSKKLSLPEPLIDPPALDGNLRGLRATTQQRYGGPFDPRALSPGGVLALQRMIGNAEVSKLLHNSPREHRTVAFPTPRAVAPSGTSLAIQRVKLKDAQHVNSLLVLYKNGGDFLVDANDKQKAVTEIAALNKADFIELINDLSTTQLRQLEALLPSVTQRIDHIATPHAYVGVAPVAQLIVGIGTFNVVPDAVAVEAHDYGTLRQTDFANLQADWNRISNSQSQIIIMEVNQDRIPIPGFSARVLACIGQIMIRPTGRRLIHDLATGVHPILIMPASVSTMLTPETQTHQMGQQVLGMPAGATPSSNQAYPNQLGGPGAGTGTRVELDPSLQDDTTQAYDKDEKPIKSPIFVLLAHELVHAKHNAQGTNAFFLPGAPGYTNKEEQNTIENEENAIRAEHLEKRLGQRVGHSGKDQRSVVIPKV